VYPGSIPGVASKNQKPDQWLVGNVECRSRREIRVSVPSALRGTLPRPTSDGAVPESLLVYGHMVRLEVLIEA
jgi:hypothetical protein